MERISWTDMVTNEKVDKIGRVLLNTIQNRRGKMICYLIRHESFIKNINAGKVEERREKRRPHDPDK